jgi:hypothetical protein
MGAAMTKATGVIKGDRLTMALITPSPSAANAPLLRLG